MSLFNALALTLAIGTNAPGVELPEYKMAKIETVIETPTVQSKLEFKIKEIEIHRETTNEILLEFPKGIKDIEFISFDDTSKGEITCLAKNIYFEARGEPRKGQKAVGLVTINRVRHERYPESICEVVYQRKQFSWVGNAKRIAQPEIYDAIFKLATSLYVTYVINNKKDTTLKGATHFHATSIYPKWRKDMRLVDTIGRHVFLIPNERKFKN